MLEHFEKSLSFDRGCGTLVVKVTDSCLVCYEFDPSAAEDLRGEEITACVQSIQAQTSSRWCSVKVSRSGASLGVVHFTWLWLKITRSLANNPRPA
ncbi:hypothetical protein TNCV_489091 [Trichonephila clavipes]|nr:hypothetical protein TNCV_489091 [Trichonephila clavipes]